MFWADGVHLHDLGLASSYLCLRRAAIKCSSPNFVGTLTPSLGSQPVNSCVCRVIPSCFLRLVLLFTVYSYMLPCVD